MHAPHPVTNVHERDALTGAEQVLQEIFESPFPLDAFCFFSPARRRAVEWPETSGLRSPS
jgi:hypothetical protein